MSNRVNKIMFRTHDMNSHKFKVFSNFNFIILDELNAQNKQNYSLIIFKIFQRGILQSYHLIKSTSTVEKTNKDLHYSFSKFPIYTFRYQLIVLKYLFHFMERVLMCFTEDYMVRLNVSSLSCVRQSRNDAQTFIIKSLKIYFHFHSSVIIKI